MPVNRPRPVLICYDIRCPRRLAKLHRFLCGVAIPVQYSVFIAYLAPNRIDLLLADLRERIHKHQDDVRLYTLPDNPDILSLGDSWLPQDTMLLMHGKSMSSSDSGLIEAQGKTTVTNANSRNHKHEHAIIIQ